MEDRYPYIRFVIDAGQVIAAVFAAVIFLGGTVRSCHHGGFGGFIGFLIAVAIAAVVYVALMVRVESLRAFLDIESTTRQLADAQRKAGETAPPTAPS